MNYSIENIEKLLVFLVKIYLSEVRPQWEKIGFTKINNNIKSKYKVLDPTFFLLIEYSAVFGNTPKKETFLNETKNRN